MERVKNTLLVLLIIMFFPLVLLYILFTAGIDNKYNKMRDNDK